MKRWESVNNGCIVDCLSERRSAYLIELIELLQKRAQMGWTLHLGRVYFLPGEWGSLSHSQSSLFALSDFFAEIFETAGLVRYFILYTPFEYPEAKRCTRRLSELTAIEFRGSSSELSISFPEPRSGRYGFLIGSFSSYFRGSRFSPFLRMNAEGIFLQFSSVFFKSAHGVISDGFQAD
jgi:hypothetical protein